MFCERPCFNSDYKSRSSLLSTDYQQSRARNYNPYNIVSNILFNIHIQRRIHTGDHHGFTTKMSLIFKVISFHSLNFVVLETLSLKKGLTSKKKDNNSLTEVYYYTSIKAMGAKSLKHYQNPNNLYKIESEMSN